MNIKDIDIWLFQYRLKLLELNNAEQAVSRNLERAINNIARTIESIQTIDAMELYDHIGDTKLRYSPSSVAMPVLRLANTSIPHAGARYIKHTTKKYGVSEEFMKAAIWGNSSGSPVLAYQILINQPVELEEDVEKYSYYSSLSALLSNERTTATKYSLYHSLSIDTTKEILC